MNGRRGRFITIEGGEGAGKSTQVGLLMASFAKAGIAARATREPGGSVNAEAIRRLLLEGEGDRWDAAGEALLLYAARRDHVRNVIEPCLAQGEWVICDRFADSTLVYQGYGRGLPLDALRALHRFALGDFAPDLTLILDLPVEEGLRRAANRAGDPDRFERLDIAFHQRLRHGFQTTAAAEPDRCVVIAALEQADAVHKAILSAIETRLGVRVPE